MKTQKDSKDSLGDRMKEYENVYRLYLPKRMPLICRLDGVSWHTLTRKCARPYDEKLVKAMNNVAIALCKRIQDAKFAYIQSDEIQILIFNSDFESQPWFNNNLNKMLSVSAARAASAMTKQSKEVFGKDDLEIEFDCRINPYPIDEVVNVFWWRQMDATRNAISMQAHAVASAKECHGKNSKQLQELIFEKSGINFSKLPTEQKRGRCVVKKKETTIVNVRGVETPIERYKWVVDTEIPIFHENKSYIEKYLYGKDYFEKIKTEYEKLKTLFGDSDETKIET